MKTHTVPIITNGPFCGEACPWLAENRLGGRSCIIFGEWLDEKKTSSGMAALRGKDCRHVTERAEALP